MNKKIEFEEFLASVSEQNQEFVKELHNQLMESGCKIEIKSAKSGYMVSYLYHKKTIANYVFRKKRNACPHLWSPCQRVRRGSGNAAG